MTCYLKSYFYYLRMIQAVLRIQHDIESVLIIPERKEMLDDHTVMILDEAVVFKLGDVYANKIRHEDDLLRMV